MHGKTSYVCARCFFRVEFWFKSYTWSNCAHFEKIRHIMSPSHVEKRPYSQLPVETSEESKVPSSDYEDIDDDDDDQDALPYPLSFKFYY